MNAEKLKKLQAQVRIGGKGSARRKKKVVHQTAATDDKKLQSSLKKLSVNTIPGIEEVNMIKDDGTVIHFNNPKAQASLSANTFAITGHGENKQITEMLPGILQQLGAESLNRLKKLANNVSSKFLSNVKEESDVPNLVANFDEISENEDAMRKRDVNKNTQRNAKFEDISKLIPVDSLNLRPTNEIRADQNTNVMNASSIIQNLIKTNESEDIIDIPVISDVSKEKTNIQNSNDTMLFNEDAIRKRDVNKNTQRNAKFEDISKLIPIDSLNLRPTNEIRADQNTNVMNASSIIQNLIKTNESEDIIDIPVISDVSKEKTNIQNSNDTMLFNQQNLTANLSTDEPTTITNTNTVQSDQVSPINSTNATSTFTFIMVPIKIPVTTTIMETTTLLETEIAPPCNDSVNPSTNSVAINTISPISLNSSAPALTDTLQSIVKSETTQPAITNIQNKPNIELLNTIQPSNAMNNPEKSNQIDKFEEVKVQQELTSTVPVLQADIATAIVPDNYININQKQHKVETDAAFKTDNKTVLADASKGNKSIDTNVTNVLTEGTQVAENKNQNIRNITKKTVDEKVNKNKPNQEQQTSIISTADENVNKNKPTQEQQTSIISTADENMNKHKPNQEQQTSIVPTTDANVNKNKPNQEQQTSIVPTTDANVNKNKPNQEQQTNIVDIKKEVQLLSTADENLKKLNQKQVDIKKEVELVSTKEEILPTLKVETDEKSINTSNLVTNANEKLPCESTEVKKLIVNDNVKPTDKKDKVKNDKNQKCAITEDTSGGASAKDKKSSSKKESSAKKNVDKKKPEPKKKNDKDKKCTTVVAAAAATAAVADKKDVNKSSETAASANIENSTIDK